MSGDLYVTRTDGKAVRTRENCAVILFHRLNVLALNVPPLRDRVEDIQPLTDGFLQEISTQLKIPMPQYDANF